MVSKPTPNQKYANEDAGPQESWIVTISMDRCGTLVGYLVFNATSLEII